MNKQTLQVAHTALDVLLQQHIAKGLDMDLFDISVQTVHIQKAEDPQEMILTHSAEIVVDAKGVASVEDFTCRTQIYEDDVAKADTTTSIDL